MSPHLGAQLLSSSLTPCLGFPCSSSSFPEKENQEQRFEVLPNIFLRHYYCRALPVCTLLSGGSNCSFPLSTGQTPAEADVPARHCRGPRGSLHCSCCVLPLRSTGPPSAAQSEHPVPRSRGSGHRLWSLQLGCN